MEVVRFDVELLPFILEREEEELKRAARARKHKKVKKIPIRYPSVNTMYPIDKRRGRKYLSKEGEMYKNYIDKCLSSQGTPPLWDFFDVTYIFYMTHDMMFTKKGELVEQDVSNFLKATEDALFEWMLESDKTSMSVHAHKRLTVDTPKIVILISPSDDTGIIYHRGRGYDPYSLEDRIEEML